MNSDSAIGQDVLARISQARGAAAQSWLASLPKILDNCARLWNLESVTPFANLSFNYVASATTGSGTQIVLKVCPADDDEFKYELECLKHLGGQGAVRLLEFNEDLGAMLLEKLLPGSPLTAGDDDNATCIAACVMQQLWRPVPESFSWPTTYDWSTGLNRLRQRFDGGTGPLCQKTVCKAEHLFRELHSSPTKQILLHGDLHHDNILRSRSGQWLAIDPKGVVGEPEYEVGALLRNPLPQLISDGNAQRTLSRRLDVLSEYLSFDRERLLAWGFAQAVLSAWWSLEDSDDDSWNHMMDCASLLEALL